MNGWWGKLSTQWTASTLRDSVRYKGEHIWENVSIEMRLRRHKQQSEKFEVPKGLNFILKDVLDSLKSFMQNSDMITFVFRNNFPKL